MEKKNDPSLIEKAWDAVRGVGYGVKKAASEYHSDKEAEHFKDMKTAKHYKDKRLEQLRDTYKTEYYEGTLYRIADKDPDINHYLKIRKEHEKKADKHEKMGAKVRKSMDSDTSSRAAYDRLTNPNYKYSDVRSFLKDKAIAEKFSSNGRSSFDIKYDAEKVSSILYPREVQSLLENASEYMSTLTQEQAEIILAFGDAKLLGKTIKVAVEPKVGEEAEAVSTTTSEAVANVGNESKESVVDTKETCIGAQIIERLDELKAENIEAAKANASTGEEMKGYIDKDKDLELVIDMAKVITDSAVQYYGNMMKVFQPVEQ